MGLAFRTWLVQTPLVSEIAGQLRGSNYYQLVYHVKRRKYESFKMWSLVVDGIRAMHRLGLLRWRLGVLKKALLGWHSYVLGDVKRKARNDRRSIVHRVRLHLKKKHYFFNLWRNEAEKTYRLGLLERSFVDRRSLSKRGAYFKKWRVFTLIFIYERKKKSLQSVITWQWLTKYTNLYTESEARIDQLEKECTRLYEWEKTTCQELAEAAEALEKGEIKEKRLEKELVHAKDHAVQSKKQGYLQAMEASRNLLPNVSNKIQMCSLAHLDLKSNVQNELDVCQEQMNTLFKALANKMFAQQKKTDEKTKSLRNYYEKNIVMILSVLRDQDTEAKVSAEGCKLEDVLPPILSKISKLQEIRDDADAALNARQIQLDIAMSNADETIQNLKDTNETAREALAKAHKSVDSLTSAKYANEKELEQLRSEIANQKKVYDLLFKKHEDLSDHFLKTSEKSNSEMHDILKLKDEEINTLQESCDGLRKRMEEQLSGHNTETHLLQEMTNDLQENLEAALSDLAKSKRQAEELNVKQMSYNLDIEKEQIKVQDLDQRYSKASADLQKVTEENLNLKAKLDLANQANLELRNAHASSGDLLAEREAKLEASRKQNSELEANKENYVVEIEELKAEIQALQESVSVRSTKLQDIEQTKLELVTNAMVYEEEIAGLKNDRDALQDALAKKNAKLTDLEQQKGELESLVDGYLENNVELSNEKESLAQSIAKKSSKVKDLEKKRAELESAAETQREEIKALRSEISKLETSAKKTAKMLEDKSSGMSQKASELHDLHKKLADCEVDIEVKAEEIETLKSDKEKLKQTIDRKNTQIQDKDAAMSDKALQVSKLEGKVEAQTDEIKSLKADRDKLQQSVSKKAQQLEVSANLESTRAQLEAQIENQNDEIKQLKSEKERLTLVSDKRAMQLKAKDSDISQRLSQLDDLERKISSLQTSSDTQKSDNRQLVKENERLQKKAEQFDSVKDKCEEQDFEIKELRAEAKDLAKVKESFVKYKGLLSVISEKITNKQVSKLDDIETDVKEFSCITGKIVGLHNENSELGRELEELKLLTKRLKEQQKRARNKREPSSVRAFKALNRRASFVPTQLPTQVWADETNRPKVSDLVSANEALLQKIEQKAKGKGHVLDLIDIYVMRKAFAVWLQAVGSEKALERLKIARSSDAAATFSHIGLAMGMSAED